MLRRLYEWMMAKALHPHAAWWLAAFAFAESSFFPIPPYPLLGLMCLAEPKKAIRFALITAIASVLGGLVETAPVPPGRPRQWVQGVAELMEERNCRPEICVHSLGEVELAYRLLIKPAIVRKPYAWQILVNVPSIGSRMHDWMPHPRAMAETLLTMVNRIREIDPDAFILVCQSGRASIYLSTYAMLLGLHVRLGTEDTMWRWPHRDEIIASNQQVVRDHVALAQLLGRRAATGDEYRALIGLPPRENGAHA